MLGQWKGSRKPVPTGVGGDGTRVVGGCLEEGTDILVDLGQMSGRRKWATAFHL